MQIERNGQRVEARTQVAGRGRDGDHVVGFSHVRSISPTAACQELLNRRDRRSGGNFLENPNLKTPDLLSPPVGELLVSCRCSREKQKTRRLESGGFCGCCLCCCVPATNHPPPRASDSTG